MSNDQTVLPPAFFARNACQVARALLGCRIECNDKALNIVEVEAYRNDPSSHIHTRRHTAAIMRDTYACLYVYFIYGMYWCLNFTCEANAPAAVLIRAGEPVNDLDAADKNAASGPGKLCRYLKLTGDLNKQPINQQLAIYLRSSRRRKIATGPRVGISRAKELPWRFYLVNNKFVSKG